MEGKRKKGNRSERKQREGKSKDRAKKGRCWGWKKKRREGGMQMLGFMGKGKRAQERGCKVPRRRRKDKDDRL